MSQKLLKKLSRYCAIALICAMTAAPAAPVWGFDTFNGPEGELISGTSGNITGSGSVGGGASKARGDASVTVGGYSNDAAGGYSAVIGGLGNTASGLNSVVIGGGQKGASYNTIGNNIAKGNGSVIIAGTNNTTGGDSSVIVGGIFNTTSDTRAVALGGRENTASGYESATIGGQGNKATYDRSVAIGGQNGTARGNYSTAIGGLYNEATKDYSTALGGLDNSAAGENSVVIGGGYKYYNSTSKKYVIVSGDNVTNGPGSVILGGTNNVTTTAATNSVVVGGLNNTASGDYSAVLGGVINKTLAGTAVAAGGYNNAASGDLSSVFGGQWNTAEGMHSVALGGHLNTVTGDSAVVVGGDGNKASGEYSLTAGGDGNTASGDRSAAIGGAGNKALKEVSATFGGWGNTTSGEYSTTLGGFGNTASGRNAVVIGGGIAIADKKGIMTPVEAENTAKGEGSVILGGTNNVTTAAASNSVAVGGKGSQAANEYAVAIGGGTAQGKNSVAIGNGVTTSATQYEAAIGSSNTNKLTFASFDLTTGKGKEERIEASGQKITNIGSSITDKNAAWSGESTFLKKLASADKDSVATGGAVNVSDLKALADEIGGGTTYTSTDNIDVDNTAGTISLKDNVKLSKTGSIDIGTGTKIADGKLMVAGTSIDSDGVKVGSTTKLTDGSLSIGSSTLTSSALSVGTSSLTTDTLKVGGKTYVNSAGINANSAKITNVAAGTSATDAANVSQLITVSASRNITLVETTNTNGSKNYEISAAGGGGTTYTSTDNIDVNNTAGTISLKDNIKLSDNGSIDVGSKTKIANGKLTVDGTTIDNSGVMVGTSSLTTSALKVGGVEYINASGIDANNKKIANVAAGTSATDAAAVGQTVSKITAGTNVTVVESTAGDGSKEYKISVDGGGSGGKIYTAGSNIKLTGTDETVINLDDNVKLAESGSISVGDKTYIDANGFNTNDTKITNLAAGTDDTDAVTMQQLAGTEEEGTNIELKSVLTEKGEMKKVSLTNNVKLDEAGSITIGNKPSPMLRAAGGTEYTEQTADSFTVSDGTNTAKLTATKLAVGKSEITTDSLKIDGKEYINAEGINANNQKIINVANGTIAQNSKDAVNGGQLWDAYNRMSNIDNRMFDMDSRINDVYNDVSGVGSQAAAMSALQAIPYNPYAPTTVTAGLGFYRSDQAVAVGVYHYIRDTVLLNIGGAFNLNGHGDAMGRAGISFALGKGAGKGGQSIGRDVIAMQSKMDAMQSEMEQLKAENKENKKVIEDLKKFIEEHIGKTK